MYKILLPWLIGLILILNWDLWLPMGVLMNSDFPSFWLQPIIRKVRDIVLIIIFTLEGLKGDAFCLNWRFLILYCMHSIKLVIKHQMKMRAYFSSLHVTEQDHCTGM